MQIVIDIPEEEYQNYLKMRPAYPEGAFCYIKAIQNGTPLPKGHGDLKDVSKIHLEKFVNCKNYSLHPLHSEDFKSGYNSAIDDVWNVLREAQTIIGADKEAENDI